MSDDTEIRLYCVIRTDLDSLAENGFLPLGKLMAQAGHAFVGCFAACEPQAALAYLNNGIQPKIVLRAKNEKELLRAKGECEIAGIPCYLVTDVGRTVFAEPTTTCLGIGPVAKKDLPKFIQRLQLLERMKPIGERDA
jgi:peptidyl-tRNA hydrolase